MSNDLTMDDFQRCLTSRLDPKIWPDQFALPVPEFVKPEDLRKGERGWIRSKDVYWIVYNKMKLPFQYRGTKVSLTPRAGYDVEVRRMSGDLELHLMFPDEQAFLDRMNAPDAKQVFDDLENKGGMDKFSRVQFRADSE